MGETFQVGDVVQLKSGGVRMTVEEIDGNDVTCVWFEGKKAERNIFAAGVLQKYTPQQPGVVSRRP